MSFVEQLVEWANSVGWPLGSIVLGLCSIIEYIFPPFPGDTVTIVGAILIPTADWPWLAVWVATVTGSTIGAVFNREIGVWFVDHPTHDTWLHRLLSRPRLKRRIDRVILQFEKRGAAILIVNRFVPALRSVFFIAAGMARLPRARVALYSVISASAFNGMLLAIGMWVGFEIDPLIEIVSAYSEAVTIAIFFVVIIWLFRSKHVQVGKSTNADD